MDSRFQHLKDDACGTEPLPRGEDRLHLPAVPLDPISDRMGCLDQPTRGKIWIHGSNISKMTPAELNRFRAEKIGFIFQQFHLTPYQIGWAALTSPPAARYGFTVPTSQR